MTATMEAIPSYLFLPATSQEYVASRPHALFLLGVSADRVSPAIQAKLRLRENFQTFNTPEAAADRLVRRIEEQWEIARTAAARAELLVGLDAILATSAPLLAVRGIRAIIADIHQRLSLAVERDKSAGVPEVRHVAGDHNWRRVDALEQGMAEFMRVCDEVRQSHVNLTQKIENALRQLNAR